MRYIMYKMKFPVGVHLGGNSLDEGMQMFTADTLFSALFLEALKMGKKYADRLLAGAQNNEITFTDAFPYMGEEYFFPKPLIQGTKNTLQADVKQKKMISFISISEISNYLDGSMDVEKAVKKVKDLGKFSIREQVGIHGNEEPEPYHVGIFQFRDGNGLYVIFALATKAAECMVSDLMKALSYVGIGGKRSSGLGKFEIEKKELNQEFFAGDSENIMLLTTSLPCFEELKDVLEGSTYQMIKKSGFIQSENYAKEYRKKREMYFFQSGSCFKKRFSGDIYDVSDIEYVKKKNGHAVYRYAKPLFVPIPFSAEKFVFIDEEAGV